MAGLLWKVLALSRVTLCHAAPFCKGYAWEQIVLAVCVYTKFFQLSPAFVKVN